MKCWPDVEGQNKLFTKLNIYDIHTHKQTHAHTRIYILSTLHVQTHTNKEIQVFLFLFLSN